MHIKEAASFSLLFELKRVKAVNLSHMVWCGTITEMVLSYIFRHLKASNTKGTVCDVDVDM